MAHGQKRPGVKQYPLRLPIALQSELEAIAKDEARSVNAQIRVFLQEALKQYREQAKRPRRGATPVAP